jgi:uncharacterized protein
MNHTVQVAHSINDVSRHEWDALANPSPARLNPFVAHDFLSALEDSSCTTAESGWQPHHILIRDKEALVGAAICYLKSHSMGEYVFDHGWAEAYQRAGGRYYPKLQLSVPFTPVTGPRLFAFDANMKQILAGSIRQICSQGNASSAHVTFAAEDDALALQEDGWLLREDVQFHWSNAGYSSFDDFLQALSSSKRKNIRKERASFKERGITFEALTGDSLTPLHWDQFYKFYLDTGARKWGSPYLNRRFFDLLHQRQRQDVVLIMAKRADRYIAGALNMRGGSALYGRNWGCVEDQPFLHFEVCYYQAMDYAIANGLTTVEAGAQGEHKLARGYLPVKTRSLHYLKHAGLRRAVDGYLVHEREAIDQQRQLLEEHAPFRHEQD